MKTPAEKLLAVETGLPTEEGFIQAVIEVARARRAQAAARAKPRPAPAPATAK